MEGVAMVVGVWQFPPTAAALLYQETIGIPVTASPWAIRQVLYTIGFSSHVYYFQTANICTLYFYHILRTLYRNHCPM